MIDTLFTDLGDVMFLFDFKIFEQEVIRRTNRAPEKLQWEQSSILKQAFTGRVSGKQFLETRARELGVEPHEITEIWDRAVLWYGAFVLGMNVLKYTYEAQQENSKKFSIDFMVGKRR